MSSLQALGQAATSDPRFLGQCPFLAHSYLGLEGDTTPKLTTTTTTTIIDFFFSIVIIFISNLIIFIIILNMSDPSFYSF
jgi:hypothetical protein